jgi:hypothetical protein
MNKNIACGRTARGFSASFGRQTLTGAVSRRAVWGATFALAASSLLLSSCTLINPYVRSHRLNCSPNTACAASVGAYAGGAAAAIDAAEDQREKYYAAAGYQYAFNSVMGLAIIGLSADAIYKGVSSNSKSPNLSLTAVTAGGAGLYGVDVWLHNKPAESAYLVGFQAITCTMLRSRAILMTQAELGGEQGGFIGDTDQFEALIQEVDSELSALQIAWDLGDESVDILPTEKADLLRETRNVEKALAKARKLLLTARAYAKEVESSGNTIRGQVDLIVASVSSQLAQSEPNITALKGLLGIFNDPSKGVADLQAVTLTPASSTGSGATTSEDERGSHTGLSSTISKTEADNQIKDAANVRAVLAQSESYSQRIRIRTAMWQSVSKLYAAGRKLNSVLASAQNFYESTRKISACTPAGGPPALEIDPPSLKDPVLAGAVLKFSVSGGVGIPAVSLNGSTGASADAKTQDLVLGVNGNAVIATVTILPGASGTLTLLAADKGSPAQQAKVAIDVEGAAPTAPKPTFKAVPGNGSAQLTFTTASAKVGTLSGYKVTVASAQGSPVSLTFVSPKQGAKSTGSPTITGVISVESAADTTIEISGLKNGEGYTLGLTATFDGAADLVYASENVTPSGPKVQSSPKPRIVAGNQSARVSFPTPAAKSGTLSGYTVSISSKDASPVALKFSSSAAGAQSLESGAFVGKIASVTGSATTLSISGLTNGTTYTLTVTANFEGAADETVLPATSVTPVEPKKPAESS